jgi:hypothetical protein
MKYVVNQNIKTAESREIICLTIACVKLQSFIDKPLKNYYQPPID